MLNWKQTTGPKAQRSHETRDVTNPICVERPVMLFGAVWDFIQGRGLDNKMQR